MDNYYDSYAGDIPQTPSPMPGSNSDEVYSAIIQEKRVENIIDQLNPERLIVEIEFRLKGYKKNQFTRKWELIGDKEKEVSDELVSDVLSVLSGLLTNNTSISNYTPDEINKIMATLIRTLIDIIREKSHIYKLESNYAERDRIMFITCSTVFSTLKRAQGGAESRRIFDGIQIRDQPQMPQQQKGTLARILGL